MIFRTPFGCRAVPRRRFVTMAAASCAVLRMNPALGDVPAIEALRPATRFDLTIGHVPVTIAGKRTRMTGINGGTPGPILRWREGDTVTLNVTNTLSEMSSIHWHGIRLPADMDGVPGLSFGGIKPGETFTYRIPVRQNGTYWYHSHSGLQEQTGLIGALVIDPAGDAPAEYDREHVILLSDWTDAEPMEIIANLKQQSDYYNFRQRTVGTFAHDVHDHGFGATVHERLGWGAMNMAPTDISDVSGVIYTYLMNGRAPGENWTGLFRPGERVKLRIINGSSMTFFDVRIPGLEMLVTHADGNAVQPVAIDEFRISPAETYDVVVRPMEDRPYTFFAQSEDRTGYARGTLATRSGQSAPIPPLDPRPMRTMKDTGMAGMNMGAADSGAAMNMQGRAASDCGAPGQSAGGERETDAAVKSAPAMAMPGMGGMEMPGMSMPETSARNTTTAHGGTAKMPAHQKHAAMETGAAKAGGSMGGSPGSGSMGHDHAVAATPYNSMSSMNMSGSGISGMAMPDSGNGASSTPPALHRGVEVQSVAAMSGSRMDEPGDGLAHNGRRVLTYAQLRAVDPSPDTRPPGREITLHLTGNMERYIWGFDGLKFSEAEPIRLALGERVRIVLINDTMMEHPIHLHGFWSELENGHGAFCPRKHTITVKPAERLSYLVSADTPGMWAFHCHLLYHMETGMFRTVVVS